MFTALCLVLLAQSSPKVASLGFSSVGIDSKLAEVYADRFATVLGKEGLRVTTRRDIDNVLGLERQRQLLGCSDGSSSCAAELAAALGVDLLLSGTLAKTGSSYTVTLRLVRASDGQEVASATQRLKNEDALGDWLDEEAPRMAAVARKAFEPKNKTLEPVSVRGAERSLLLPATPAIAGLGCLIGGGVLLGLAGSQASALSARPLTLGSVDEVNAAASRGQSYQTWGWVLLAAGGVGLLASGAWYYLSGSVQSSTEVTFMPLRGGAMVSVGGALP